MVRYSFVFLIIFAIGILFLLRLDMATSVVPGWHSAIYMPWFFITLVQILWLGVISIIYFFVERSKKIINGNVTRLHIVLSLFVFVDNVYVFFDNYYATRIAMVAPYFFFLMGQLIFIVGVVKAKKKSYSGSLNEQ